MLNPLLTRATISECAVQRWRCWKKWKKRSFTLSHPGVKLWPLDLQTNPWVFFHVSDPPPPPHPQWRAREHWLCGELDEGVDLVAPVAVVGEALEVDDEVLGQGPEVKLLGGLFVLAALGAVPGVLLTQLLRFREEAQAVLQLQHRSFLGVAAAHRVMLLHVLEGKTSRREERLEARVRKQDQPHTPRWLLVTQNHPHTPQWLLVIQDQPYSDCQQHTWGDRQWWGWGRRGWGKRERADREEKGGVWNDAQGTNTTSSILKGTPPAPYSREQTPPAPYSREQTPPAPYSREQTPPAPYSREQTPPAPYSKEQTPPAPYSREQTPPAPYSREQTPPAPYSREQTPPAPYSKEQTPPAPYSREQKPPAPYSTATADDPRTMADSNVSCLHTSQDQHQIWTKTVLKQAMQKKKKVSYPERGSSLSTALSRTGTTGEISSHD